MAVDQDTLRLLVESGIKYTILSGQQVQNLPLPGGGGPFKVELSGGGNLGVFVRNDALSSEISFNIHNLGGAGHWTRNTLGQLRNAGGPLTLLATEGETFGHHYAGEDQFLHWLVAHEAPAIGFSVTTLDQYFEENPPQRAVELNLPSSWSDQHGLASWATGVATAQVNTTWKGALRRALDNAANEIDRAYEELCTRLKVDPWPLRDQYALVLMDAENADAFVEARVKKIKAEDSAQLKALLTAQELAQRMYTSYTFTNNVLDSRQPRYAIACAAAALSIAQQATGLDLSDRLASDLMVVIAAEGGISGKDILDKVVREYEISLKV
jgi:alpha-amylase/alpha-mannosidase (GH57 family)